MTNTTEATTTNRVSLATANKEAFTLRAIDAIKAVDKKHLTFAYTLLVKQGKTPSNVPADVQGEEAHAFTPETVYKILPISYLVKLRPNMAGDLQELENALSDDNAANTSAKAAFMTFVTRNNGGEALPYNDVAAKALFQSCKAIRIDTKNGMNGKATVKSALKANIAKALYLAATGNKSIEE